MKSNSISRPTPPAGISDVVRPRAETYSTICHQWFTMGSSSRRTLPTIWVHRWKVSRVSWDSDNESTGQFVAAMRRG